MTRNATGWLHFTQQRREPALLLVCFPCAGGSALTFSPWSSQLSDRVELAAVQLPGRDTRSHEPFVSRIETVVEHVVRALCERGCTRVAHFEHSMGALLTFEVARKLVAHRQVTILNLIVAGRTAPHHLHPREMLHRLDDRTLVAKLRVLSGTPDVVLESAETILFPAQSAGGSAAG